MISSLQLILLLLVAAGIPGCTSEGRQESLRIAGTNWAPYELFSLPETKEFYLHSGLQFKFSVFTEMIDSRRAFERGNVDGALLTTYEALLLKDSGVDPVIVLLTDYSDGADGIVAKNQIQSLAELKHKTIGVEIGTVAHFTLMEGLKKVGLSETDVKILNLGSSDLPTAFKSGKIDAAASWEPYLSKMASTGNGHILFTSHQIPGEIVDVLVVNRKVYTDRKTEFEKLATGWFKIVENYQNSPRKIAEKLSSLNHRPVEDFLSEMAGAHLAGQRDNERFFGLPHDPGKIISSLKTMNAYLVKNGLIKHTPDFESMIGFGLKQEHK